MPNPGPQEKPSARLQSSGLAAEHVSKTLKRVGKFDIVAKIGQGGMGAVFKVRQRSLDRIVALKILPPSVAKNAQFIERFQREARASAKLSHPNIVQGIDVGHDADSGLWYFAMEFVEGASTKDLLKEQKVLPEVRALEIARDVARALECVNAHQMVHRDVKPDNILLTSNGDAKLADLGLAKQLSEDGSLTQSGQAVGTPHYMAPEQARGEDSEIDIRTDLYALGATLFHLVTGKPPFSGATSASIMAKHLSEEAPQAHKVNPNVSEGCSRLISRLMQKKREQRFQTPAELLVQIERLLNPEPEVGMRVPAGGARKASTTGIQQPVRRTGALPRVSARSGAYEPRGGSPVLPIAVGGAVLLAVCGMLFSGGGSHTERLAVADRKPKSATQPAAPEALRVEAPRFNVDEMLRAAREWEQSNPDEYGETLARYRKCLEAARAGVDGAALEQAKAAIDAVLQRQSAAADAEWKSTEDKVRAAVAKLDYDAALAACQGVPRKWTPILQTRISSKARELSTEADGKMNGILQRAEAAGNDAAAALKILGEAEGVAYAPTADRLQRLKSRLESERLGEAEARHKKDLQSIEKHWSELAGRYVQAVVDATDLKPARDIAAEGRKDPSLSPVQAQVQGMEDLLAGFDELRKMEADILAAFKGQPITLPGPNREAGKIDRIEAGFIHVQIAMGSGVASKRVKIADLPEEQRGQYTPTLNPRTDAQRLALGILKLARGRDDLAGAQQALKSAEAFPLTPLFAEVLRKRQVAAAEELASAAWQRISAQALKLDKDKAKPLLLQLAEFEQAYGKTEFSAGLNKAGTLPALRAKVAALVGVFWQSYKVVIAQGAPYGTVQDDAGQSTASFELYESGEDGGVAPGRRLIQFYEGKHPDGFNRVENFLVRRRRGASTAPPYVGKSTVDRGSDDGEANAPAPKGVRDLQMHPPASLRLVVAAFIVPSDGAYTVSNLAARRVSDRGMSARYKVFNSAQKPIAEIKVNNDRAWVTDPRSFPLGNLKLGDKIYFTVANEDDPTEDAVEVNWTITRVGAQ